MNSVQLLTLTTNYRSCRLIIESANNLIRNNKNRIDVSMVAAPGAGEGDITVSSHECPAHELAFITSVATDHRNKGMAVLFPTNALADQCRNHLEGLGVKVKKKVVEKTSKDALAGRAILSFMCNPFSDSIAFRAFKANGGNAELAQQQAAAKLSTMAIMCNGPLRNLQSHRHMTMQAFSGMVRALWGVHTIGKDWLCQLAGTLPEPFTLFDLVELAFSKDEEGPETEGVAVGTVHSYKGREADTVVLGGCEAALWEGKGEDQEESRRLFYVGVTRAREKLVLSWCHNRPNPFTPWKQNKNERTRFINEMQITERAIIP